MVKKTTKRRGTRKGMKYTKLKRASKSRISTFYGFNKPMAIVPDRFQTKLLYSEFLARAPGAISDQYIYSLNSLYDPNVTAAGSQPSGYDQLASLYGAYRVLKAKYRMTITSNLTGVSMIITAQPSMSSTEPNSVNESLRSPFSSYRVIGINSAEGAVTFSRTVDLKKFTGVRGYDSDDNYGAGIGASPAFQVYLQTNVASSDGATNVNYNSLLVIEYFCEFYNRIQLNLS